MALFYIPSLRNRSRAKLSDEITPLLPVHCLRALALRLRRSDGSRTSAPYQDAPKIKADNGLAPLAIAGNQLHYRDNHGSYTYTFFSDGRYRFASVHQTGTSADSREGRYRYVITAPGKAALSFDKESTIRLRFESPLDRTGTTDGDVRPFAFTISHSGGG
jgi:hypothetical protein